MRKVHCKVVLDIFVVADDNITHPEDVLKDCINDVIIDGGEGIDIHSFDVLSCEVTDSR